MTSYEIVYGQPRLPIHSYEIGTTKVESVDQSLQEEIECCPCWKLTWKLLSAKWKCNLINIELKRCLK